MDNPSADPIVAELRAMRQELAQLRSESAAYHETSKANMAQSLAAQQTSITNQLDSIATQRKAVAAVTTYRVALGIFLAVLIVLGLVSLIGSALTRPANSAPVRPGGAPPSPSR